MTSIAVHDIFDINTTLYEKLSESLQALGVNLSVINNNMSLPYSSFTATLQISVEKNYSWRILLVRKKNVIKNNICYV